MLEIIKEHISFKKQIFKLAKSDLIKTYRGTALGWSWAIIKPTITIVMYWFVFTIGLRHGADVNGYPYYLWLIAGVVPWFYMDEMITQGIESIRKYSYLVTKMNFPVSTIPTFVSISKLIVNIALLSVVAILFIIYNKGIDIYYLQLPFYILMMFLFFTSWGLFSAPLAAISKDFSNLVKSFVSVLFWFSGVMWNTDGISNSVARMLLKINPVTYFARGFRNVFVYKQWFFEDKDTLIFLCVLLVMMVSSILVYRKLRKDIPDVL